MTTSVMCICHSVGKMAFCTISRIGSISFSSICRLHCTEIKYTNIRMRTDRLLTVSQRISVVGVGGLSPPCRLTLHADPPSMQTPLRAEPQYQTPPLHQPRRLPLSNQIPLPPGQTPSVNRMTHECENITFPTSLRYAAGKKCSILNCTFFPFWWLVRVVV